ncbi:Putative proline/betaine transporter [Seminavis robusta]|uniref:Proline/betaine transporter n=1 Tax=Seminavis robusta TaxID=568900 RepID=A0A9N8DDQ7_9STRA|nr:Putative proline/betaine transporter [Seminavis robusta]|eukprot:Sro72_g039640.1 Putative proline/betaine transporter (521) ;mRNA; f:5172-6945
MSLLQDESTPLLPSHQQNQVQLNSNSLGAHNTASSASTAPRHHDHLKTYTAGEDASRLAAVAKELGLKKHRKSRVQVRTVILSGIAGLPLPRVDEGEEESQPQASWLEMLAGVAGNVLEWYDFAVFGYFGDIIGKVFFPPAEGDAQTLESFAVFGGAFLMRPVGGFLLGYLGDVYGRKQALTTSIFLMAFPTFAMGCLPSYERVGYWSTCSLIIIRLLQGMSVGGQLISSLVFTLENVPTEHWGLYGSFVWATGNIGVLLGSLVGYVVRRSFTHEQLVAYGWRVPFLCGIIVSVAGFYLKASEDKETEQPQKQKQPKAKKQDNDIIRKVFSRSNLRPLFASAMVASMWCAGFYLTFVWMAVYMTDLIDKPVPAAFAVNAVALLLSVCLLFPVAGWLSDTFGRRTIMSIGGVSVALFSPFLVRIIGETGNPWLAFGAQTFLGVCLSFWGSPMCAWLVESFEPETRVTSVAVGYNIGQAIVGGSTPAVATYLVGAVGPTSPGWIYTTIATMAMLGLWVVAPK